MRPSTATGHQRPVQAAELLAECELGRPEPRREAALSVTTWPSVPDPRQDRAAHPAQRMMLQRAIGEAVFEPLHPVLAIRN